MTVSLGRVDAELAEPDREMSTKLVELINANVNPPSPVSADDVHVRAMYVVSDSVNSFGGRFPADEHPGLAALLVDSPVLVGHRKDQLPIARTFHAMTVEREGRPWVKSYFYWLKNSERAEELRANLDGGVYKECSLAFTFHLPECSVCGKDIRRCEHQPFESYANSGHSEPCHFNYRRVERVLETSLVYRGAVPDTAVVRDLANDESRLATGAADLFGLDGVDDFLVIPRYDGLPVAVTVSGRTMILHDRCGEVSGEPIRLRGPEVQSRLVASGLLVGQRGKERCSASLLRDFLAGRPGPVTRMVLNIHPHQGLLTPPRPDGRQPLDIRMFPYRIANRSQLDRAVREIMTRDGVEIRPLGGSARPGPDALDRVCHYRPVDTSGATSIDTAVALAVGDGSARLTMRWGSETSKSYTFELPSFDLAALVSGRRMPAIPAATGPAPAATHRIITGRAPRTYRPGEAMTFDLEGEPAGRYLLRPIRLHGRECFLFGRQSTRRCTGGER